MEKTKKNTVLKNQRYVDYCFPSFETTTLQL